MENGKGKRYMAREYPVFSTFEPIFSEIIKVCLGWFRAEVIAYLFVVGKKVYLCVSVEEEMSSLWESDIPSLFEEERYSLSTAGTNISVHYLTMPIVAVCSLFVGTPSVDYSQVHARVDSPSSKVVYFCVFLCPSLTPGIPVDPADAF